MAGKEDRICRLCSDLLAKRSDEDLELLVAELRDALHQHIENLRERALAFIRSSLRACQKRYTTTQ